MSNRKCKDCARFVFDPSGRASPMCGKMGKLLSSNLAPTCPDYAESLEQGAPMLASFPDSACATCEHAFIYTMLHICDGLGPWHKAVREWMDTSASMVKDQPSLLADFKSAEQEEAGSIRAHEETSVWCKKIPIELQIRHPLTTICPVMNCDGWEMRKEPAKSSPPSASPEVS